MARLILIRHAESVANAERRFTTGPHEPLSPRGREEALALGSWLRARFDPVALYASPFVRALETARLLGASFALDPVPIEDLREQDFGALRGRPYAELGLDPFAPDYEPPEGESWEAFHARVDRAWLRVDAAARAAGGPIAVVTHGLVCHSVVSRRAVLAPGLSLAGRGWRNTSVTVLEAGQAWTVRILDDVSHLDEAPEGGAA